MKKADIGLIGLAVMGENLVMNMESKGFTVAVFNRTTSKVTHFVEGRGKGKNIIGTYSLEEFLSSLEKPRRRIGYRNGRGRGIGTMAGSAVSAAITDSMLLPASPPLPEKASAVEVPPLP